MRVSNPPSHATIRPCVVLPVGACRVVYVCSSSSRISYVSCVVRCVVCSCHPSHDASRTANHRTRHSHSAPHDYGCKTSNTHAPARAPISERQIASTCMQFTRTGPPEPVTAPYQNQWVGDYGFGVVRQSPVSAPPLLRIAMHSFAGQLRNVDCPDLTALRSTD